MRIKPCNPFSKPARWISAYAIEMNRDFALDVIRLEQDEGHTFLQLKVLPSQAAKRSVASKSHLCLAALVVEVLNGIEIGVDIRHRHSCNLTLEITGVTRLAGARPVD